MKYICLGYLEPGKFEGMTEDERHATFDECFEYNDHLRQRTSCRRSTPSASGDRVDPVLEKRPRVFHSPIVTSDLAPNFKSRNHDRGRDSRVNPTRRGP